MAVVIDNGMLIGGRTAVPSVVQPDFQGVWDSGTSYTGLRDVVVGSDSQPYISLIDSTNQDPTATSGYWSPISLRGITFGKDVQLSNTQILALIGNNAAQGTLIVDTLFTVGKHIVVGSITYTIVTDGTAASPGEINRGTNLTEAHDNIVNAFQGGDGYNVANSALSLSMSFSVNNLVITAATRGAAGNSIVTTTNSSDGANGFDGATLGTTRLGTDAVGHELIPAPGDGLLIVLLFAYLIVDIVGVYTSVGTSQVDPLIGPHAVAIFDIRDLTVFSVGRVGNNLDLASIDYSGDTMASLNNQPLMLTNQNDNLGGGNSSNTLSIRIWFSIMPSVPFS